MLGQGKRAFPLHCTQPTPKDLKQTSCERPSSHSRMMDLILNAADPGFPKLFISVALCWAQRPTSRQAHWGKEACGSRAYAADQHPFAASNNYGNYVGYLAIAFAIHVPQQFIRAPQRFPQGLNLSVVSEQEPPGLAHLRNSRLHP